MNDRRMEDIVERAAEFAKVAHEAIHQRRKYTNEPYIVHPTAVAATVEKKSPRADVFAEAGLVPLQAGSDLLRLDYRPACGIIFPTRFRVVALPQRRTTRTRNAPTAVRCEGFLEPACL